MIHYQVGHSVEPLYMIVQGIVGTCKSYLIGGICIYLKQATMPNHFSLLLLALIRVVAFNIGGSKIHSKLKIPIKNFMPLEGTHLMSF